jgi:seryl-tRNA synthetase
MLDLKLIRDDPDAVRTRLGVRGRPEYMAAIDELLTVDEQRRALITEVDRLRGRRNEVSPQVGRLKQAANTRPRIRSSSRCASSASA